MVLFFCPSWKIKKLWPQYQIELWNVHDRATHAIARTNNSMEACHQQFQRRLNHHPALSDFLNKFHDDIRKQAGNAANAQLFPPKRRNKHVVCEQRVAYILNDADIDLDNDGELLNLVTLLGLTMDGYVNGFRDIPEAHPNQEEILDEGQNDGEEENGGEDNPDPEEDEHFPDGSLDDSYFAQRPSTSNSSIV